MRHGGGRSPVCTAPKELPHCAWPFRMTAPHRLVFSVHMRCKRGQWHAGTAAVVLAGALASAGCSLTLSGPEPRVAGRPRKGVLECDTGKGLVAFDGIIATSLGVSALGFLSSEDSGAAAVPAIVGFGFFAAALRGNGAVNDCRAAHEELQLQLTSAAAPRQARRKKKTPPALAAPGAPPSATPPRPTAAPPAATPPRPATAPPAATPPRPATAPPAAPTPPTPPLPASAPPPPRPVITAPPAGSEEPWDDFWTEVP